MSKKFFEKSGLLKKLKSIKHIEIIIAILFALIILLVFFSTSGGLGKSTAKTPITSSTTATAYAEEIENKLEEIITKLDGAGNVSVMVMCDENTTENSVPKIVSAVVVSSGASNVFVKLNIIKTVEALLNLDTKNIEVLSGK